MDEKTLLILAAGMGSRFGGLKQIEPIDKNGNWVIKPKYSHICSLKNYYTRACLDDEHCGVIDKFGNEITLLTYSISKLNCNDSSCRKKLCTLKDKNDASCN